MSGFDTRVAVARRTARGNSSDGIERRTIAARLEVRAAADGTKRVTGLGIVYNSPSEDLGGFVERIAPGAARKVLATRPDVRGLFNHDPNLVLGRTAAGTMTVEDEAAGVRYTIDLPDTTYANDLAVSIARGDVSQSSFAFRVARHGDRYEEDPESGLLIRTITEFSGLYDMSPVTYPAYESSTVGVNKSSDSREREPVHVQGHGGMTLEGTGLATAGARRAARQRRLRLYALVAKD